MARTLAPEISSANDADDTETHDIMRITLPLATGESQPVVLKIATGKVVIGTDIYQAHIRSMFTISYTRGQTPDGGEFTIANLNKTYGQLFLDASRLLDGAYAEVMAKYLAQRFVDLRR